MVGRDPGEKALLASCAKNMLSLVGPRQFANGW